MSTVIIGAGIIGTSTAYYLSQSDTSPADIHLIESSPQLFASASGYAGGFLARDWFSPSLSPLGALSFDLHKQLAQDYNGHQKWGYTQSTSSSLEETVGKRGQDWLTEGVSRAKAANASLQVNDNGPAWLTGRGKLDVLSNGDTTAQIDPLRLCDFLMSTCHARGVQLHQPACALSLSRNSSGALCSVRITSGRPSSPKLIDIPCTRLILAAGAWTPQVFSSLFPSSPLEIPISSLAGYSLLLRSPQWLPASETSSSPPFSSSSPSTSADSLLKAVSSSPCYAVFTTDPSGYSPELFARRSGHIYIAGLNSSTYPLPSIATERIIDREAIETLKTTAKRLMGEDLVVEREGLCWRPVTKKGTPIISEINGEGGVWIAAGHGAWGISLSLGTGCVLAEMVEGRECSVDVKGLKL